MTPCEKVIREIIATEGPISVERFMELALQHPEHGYYQQAPAIGAQGDFITAPEISQLFGEVLGAWVMDMWLKLGSPSPFNLVELGPGRGTLMADIMRVGSQVKNFTDACQITLVDTNTTLQQEQQEKLSHYTCQWLDHFDTSKLTNHPTLVIANEFFDAFPVRQFEKSQNQWFERHVSVNGDNLEFIPIESTESPHSSEFAPQAETYMQHVCKHLNEVQGAILVIDYGYDQDHEQIHTLQALKSHEHSSPLDHIGESDLTAHVNFKSLSNTAQATGLATTPITTQGRFLSSLGILERSQQLQAQNPLQIPQIMSGLLRLTQPQQMGSLFKVMCAYAPKNLTPEGFL